MKPSHPTVPPPGSCSLLQDDATCLALEALLLGLLCRLQATGAPLPDCVHSDLFDDYRHRIIFLKMKEGHWNQLPIADRLYASRWADAYLALEKRGRDLPVKNFVRCLNERRLIIMANYETIPAPRAAQSDQARGKTT